MKTVMENASLGNNMDLEPFDGELDTPVTKVTNNNIKQFAGIGVDGIPTDKVKHEFSNDAQIQSEIQSLKGGVQHTDLEPFSGKLDSEFEPFTGTLDHENSSFKSGTAFKDTKDLIPSLHDISSTWDTLKKQWANRHNTPMTPADITKMMKDEHAAGTGVIDALGSIPAMLGGAAHGVYEGIKERDATKGLSTAKDTMGKLLPSSLFGNKEDQSLEGYKAAMAPFTGMSDVVNAIPKGYGEILDAAGAHKTAAQVSDAGELALMGAMGFAGTRAGLKAFKRAEAAKMDLADLGKEQEAILNTPKPEVPLPDLNMDDVAPMIHDKDPLSLNPTETPLPELNLWDGSQTKGLPPLEEPQAAAPFNTEIAPVLEDPLGPEATARRTQMDTEGRYQEQNDFNNHPEDTTTSIAMKKAQEEAAYAQHEAEKQQQINDTHQLRDQVKEVQQTAMEAERQLDFARRAGEIDYKHLEDSGDKSIMDAANTDKLTSYLRDGNLSGALAHIADVHTNPMYRGLAKWLGDRVGGINVKLHDESVLQHGDRDVTGYYDSSTNTLGLSGRGAASPHTLLHEVIHSLTSDFLNTHANHPLTMGLRSIFQQAAKTKGSEKFQSIGNIKEFAAEAMSNPKYQEFLKGITLDKRNLFSRFVDSVKSMLGMKVPKLGTAFDHAIDLSKQVAELSNEPVRAEMVQRFKDAGVPNHLIDLMATNKVERDLAKTGPNTEIAQAISKMSGAAQALKDFIPAKFTTEQLIEQMKTEPDISGSLAKRAVDRFTSGGLYQSLKHPNNTLIKKTYESIGEASDRAQSQIDNYVHPLLDSIRGLDKTEKADAHVLRMIMDAEQIPLDAAELAKRGASEAMIKYMTQQDTAMKAVFKALNDSREAAGKKPIDPRLGYAVTKMTGDFRKSVFKDKILEDGTVEREFIGNIGSNYRGMDKGPLSFGLAKIEAAITAAHPEWIIGEEKYLGRGAKRDNNGSRQAAYNEALQIISEDSPHVQELAKTLSDSYTSDAYAYMNAKKHTMAKKGTFGGEGRKAWEEMSNNADDFFKAEVQYAETIFKWSELSKSVQELKPLLSEAEVSQRNAKKWSDAYIEKALGNNPSEMGKALDKVFGSIADATGIGATPLSSIGRISKSFTNTVFLSFNHMYNAINALQPLQGMPIVKALLESRGVKSNFDLGTGYSYLFEGSMTAMRDKLGDSVLGKSSEFEKQINNYGKEHHVFGNELLDRSNQVSKNASYYGAKAADFMSNTIESGTNRVVFSGISHMLNDGGMKVHEGLFETAFKLTKLIMHDYRAHESSMIWQDLGPISSLSKNLTKYKMGQISQLNMMAREIPTHGSYRPLAVSLISQIAFAGVLGTIAFNEADALVHMISNRMGKPFSLRKWVLDNASDMASFGLPNLMGMDMHARTGSPDIIPNGVGDAFFPGMSKIMDTGNAALNLANDPSTMNAKRLVREVTPGMVNGMLDRKWFSTTNNKGEEMSVNRKPSDYHPTQAGVIRSERDKQLKSWGIMGSNESKKSMLLFENQKLAGDYADKRKADIKSLVDTYFNNGKVLTKEDIEPIRDRYLKHEGDPKQFAGDILKGEFALNVDAETRRKIQSASSGVTGLRQFERFKGNQ